MSDPDNYELQEVIILLAQSVVTFAIVIWGSRHFEEKVISWFFMFGDRTIYGNFIGIVTGSMLYFLLIIFAGFALTIACLIIIVILQQFGICTWDDDEDEWGRPIARQALL